MAKSKMTNAITGCTCEKPKPKIKEQWDMKITYCDICFEVIKWEHTAPKKVADDVIGPVPEPEKTGLDLESEEPVMVVTKVKDVKGKILAEEEKKLEDILGPPSSIEKAAKAKEAGGKKITDIDPEVKEAAKLKGLKNSGTGRKKPAPQKDEKIDFF